MPKECQTVAELINILETLASELSTAIRSAKNGVRLQTASSENDWFYAVPPNKYAGRLPPIIKANCFFKLPAREWDDLHSKEWSARGGFKADGGGTTFWKGVPAALSKDVIDNFNHSISAVVTEVVVYLKSDTNQYNIEFKLKTAEATYCINAHVSKSEKHEATRH